MSSLLYEHIAADKETASRAERDSLRVKPISNDPWHLPHALV